MRRSVPTWFLLPLLLAHWGAHAQIYMCKDASGRTITSDRPIPECADRAMRQYDRQGIARRDLPPPLTGEQKRQMALQEEQRKAAEAAAAERQKSDRALRFRYRTEGDIEVARKRSIEGAQDQLKRDKTALAAGEKQLQAVQIEVDSYKKKNAAVPMDLQRKMAESGLAVSAAKKSIKEGEAEMATINAQYDETLARYRQLTPVAAN